jgi:putative FmdB family regulatory protein
LDLPVDARAWHGSSAMPAYDYRCTVCGREMEIIHAIGDRVSTRAHTRLDDASKSCDGALERLVSLAGFNKNGVGQKPPSDDELKRTGFTKYVRGATGYEKAFGTPDTPDFVNRE